MTKIWNWTRRTIGGATAIAIFICSLAIVYAAVSDYVNYRDRQRVYAENEERFAMVKAKQESSELDAKEANDRTKNMATTLNTSVDATKSLADSLNILIRQPSAAKIGGPVARRAKAVIAPKLNPCLVAVNSKIQRFGNSEVVVTDLVPCQVKPKKRKR